MTTNRTGTESIQTDIWRTSSIATCFTHDVVKKPIASLALVGAVVGLTGCAGQSFENTRNVFLGDSVTYSDERSIAEFTAGVEVFCGEGNYEISFGSSNPLGGPVRVGMSGSCTSIPKFPESEYAERFKRAFPDGGEVEEILFDDGSGRWEMVEIAEPRSSVGEILPKGDVFGEQNRDIYYDGLTLRRNYDSETQGPTMSTGFAIVY